MGRSIITEDFLKSITMTLEDNNRFFISNEFVSSIKSLKDERLAWFAVGEYKKRANVVGGKETVKPGKVAEKMAELIMSYEQKKAVDINDIISFHADFERMVVSIIFRKFEFGHFFLSSLHGGRLLQVCRHF